MRGSGTINDYSSSSFDQKVILGLIGLVVAGSTPSLSSNVHKIEYLSIKDCNDVND